MRPARPLPARRARPGWWAEERPGVPAMQSPCCARGHHRGWAARSTTRAFLSSSRRSVRGRSLGSGTDADQPPSRSPPPGQRRACQRTGCARSRRPSSCLISFCLVTSYRRYEMGPTKRRSRTTHDDGVGGTAPLVSSAVAAGLARVQGLVRRTRLCDRALFGGLAGLERSVAAGTGQSLLDPGGLTRGLRVDVSGNARRDSRRRGR